MEAQSFTWNKIERKNKFRTIFPDKWAMGKQVIGDIAQLGERLNGIQEVSGSIPLISTYNGLIIRRINSV